MRAGRYLAALPVAALALAACEPDPRTAAAPEEELVEPPAPPPEDPRRYIGRWAPSADQCATDWWRFWADELRTNNAGLFCDILPPDADFSDTELRMLCRQDGPSVRETWTLDYAHDGGQLTITRPNGDQFELVKCA